MKYRLPAPSWVRRSSASWRSRLPRSAKTVKECRAEWTAHKAANQAKGITEKSLCR